MTASMLKNMTKLSVTLAMFATAGTMVLVLTFQFTYARIQQNERDAMLMMLNQLVLPGSYDNALLEDTRQAQDAALLGVPEPVTMYRARNQQQPVAVIIASAAPNGYNGLIRLLVGIQPDGTLLGVRVTAHTETPGLGDLIEAKRSPWILAFAGKSLDNPGQVGWAVKKDGGEFDQFTGATITPRAVVRGVYNTLQYYQQHQAEIWQ